MSNQRIIIITKALHEKEYAEKLYNRIKTNYGDYSIFLWDESTYKNEKMSIVDSDKVIFFGNARNMDALAKDDNLRGKFNKFGMKYGWAGNICTVYASATDVSWNNFFYNFRDYCTEINAKYSDVLIPKKNMISEVFSILMGDKRAAYHCQYSALLHEFLDGGGFKGFMVKANTQTPAFRRIVDQLPDNNEYDKTVASLVSWETIENRDGYKIQISNDKCFDCFRILNEKNELVTWGERSFEKIGIMAFLALFEEKIIEIVETQDIDKKHKPIYQTLDSLEPINKLVEEAEIALKEKKRTINDSPLSAILVSAIPEVLASFMVSALYFDGLH